MRLTLLLSIAFLTSVLHSQTFNLFIDSVNCSSEQLPVGQFLPSVDSPISRAFPFEFSHGNIEYDSVAIIPYQNALIFFDTSRSSELVVFASIIPFELNSDVNSNISYFNSDSLIYISYSNVSFESFTMQQMYGETFSESISLSIGARVNGDLFLTIDSLSWSNNPINSGDTTLLLTNPEPFLGPNVPNPYHFNFGINIIPENFANTISVGEGVPKDYFLDTINSSKIDGLYSEVTTPICFNLVKSNVSSIRESVFNYKNRCPEYTQVLDALDYSESSRLQVFATNGSLFLPAITQYEYSKLLPLLGHHVLTYSLGSYSCSYQIVSH